MSNNPRIIVVIPALNEAGAIARVVSDIPSGVADAVVVVDNGSTDATVEEARAVGATVVHEPRQGYGYACLRGIAWAESHGAEIVVFLDGDYSDHPDQMPRLVEPIVSNAADLVVGSRMSGTRERGAIPAQAVLGNRLAAALIRLVWGARVTDLGPFRAIRIDRLRELGMRDGTFGWTIEMQIKVARRGLRYTEVPVPYRRRIGRSKISGTLSGTVRASSKILWTIGKYAAADLYGRIFRRRAIRIFT